MKSSQHKILASLQHFYPLMLFLLIVYVCWSLARAFWLMIAPPSAPDIPLVPLQSQGTNIPMGNGLDIFSQPVISQPSVPPPDVKIVGLTSAIPEHFSFAILNFNGKVKSYKLNDILDGTAFKLASVKSNHIVLADNHGQTAKIDFGKPFLLDQSGQSQSKTMINSQGNVLTLTNQITNSAPSAMPTQNSSMLTPEDIAYNNFLTQQIPPPTPLDDPLSAIQQDPAGYLTQIGVAGAGDGYVVTDAMPTGIKDRLGLQTGDKVISLNGQTVGQNPSQDAILLEQVRQLGEAQIQVQRGEQVITLNQSF